jgi:pyridoxamine 5'-phosphate oxidase family protein
MMRTFTPAELAYLGELRLGRLATVDPAGRPHVVPVGMWQVNRELGTVDVTGHDFAATRKYHHVADRPTAALLVDDLAPGAGWHPRAVMVSGPAEALGAGKGGEALIRIRPEQIVSWGLEDAPAGA